MPNPSCCDPCPSTALSCSGVPLVVPFPCKSEILLLSADWNADGSGCGDVSACFYVNPCYGGRKAKLELLAEVGQPCRKTKKLVLKICIDDFGRFCVCIPKFTRALCLDLEVCPRKRPCDCFLLGELRAPARRAASRERRSRDQPDAS